VTGRTRRWTGPLEAFALLTAVPVPARAAESARGVLPWAPLVGLVLGGLAAGVGVLGARTVSPLVGAVLALVLLALLTRGLHLDGLADTADGLGPLRDRERALAVMRQGDVGPFGVAAVVLVLLLQASCAAVLLATEGGWVAIWLAVAVARLAMARTGLPGTPLAAGSTLGRAVAGTVHPGALAAWAVVLVALVVAAAGADPVRTARLCGAAIVGLLAAELVQRRSRRRLGGVNGDVMGAVAEVTTAVTLLGAAAVLG
jgi:cobalamin 5'-phosphate synthase/cobalamin synthase